MKFYYSLKDQYEVFDRQSSIVCEGQFESDTCKKYEVYIFEYKHVTIKMKPNTPEMCLF